MAESFRCAADAAERGDPLAGSASTFPAFLLLEHPGPWGVDALRDARLPDGLGAHLASTARGTGVRVLLARRHRGGPARTSGQDKPGHRVIAAHAGAGWLRAPAWPTLRRWPRSTSPPWAPACARAGRR